MKKSFFAKKKLLVKIFYKNLAESDQKHKIRVKKLSIDNFPPFFFVHILDQSFQEPKIFLFQLFITVWQTLEKGGKRVDDSYKEQKKKRFPSEIISPKKKKKYKSVNTNNEEDWGGEVEWICGRLNFEISMAIL